MDQSTPPIFQQLDCTARFPYTRGEYLRRFAWQVVQATLFRFSPARAYGWRRFWLRRFGAKVGRMVGVRPTVRILHPWLLELGDYVSLADGVEVYNLGPVRVGDHAVVSQRAHLCGGTHDYSRADLPLIRSPITIGGGAWICTEAFVGPGVNVGTNAVVGARAVVVRDVEPNVVVAGNPAKVVKQRPMVDGDSASAEGDVGSEHS